MKPLRNHRTIVVAVAVLVTGSIAAAGYASWTSTSVSASEVALSASERQALEQRANVFRERAHGLIQKRTETLTAEPAAGAPPDALAVQAMRAMSYEFAALNGEKAPKAGAVYASTRVAAQKAISDAIVDTDQPVFVAVFHGDFIGYQAKVPANQLPTGKVMMVTFDAETLAVTDWGLAQQDPNTAVLGPSTSLGM